MNEPEEQTDPMMGEADPMPLAEAVRVGGAPPVVDEPTRTLEEFAATLPRTHRAGFVAYARASGLTRATLATWRAALDAHANRPIR